MAKLTLISMVQKILSSMDSDDVNSIADTEEALQVVDIIEDTYNHMMVELDPASLHKTCQMDNLGDVTQPTSLKIPDDVSDIGTLKYEITETGATNRDFRDLKYLHPQAFVDKLLIRSSGNPEVEEILTEDNTPLFIFNDRFPTWWTSFDDETIVADAYDNTESTTLLGSKTLALCTVLPPFTKSDKFIADMPDKMFPLFLAESRRACHLYLKQQDSAVDARRALTGTHTFRQKRERAHDRKKKISFGRK